MSARYSMARFKARFKKKTLRAKYVCPACGRAGYYRCHSSGPGEPIYGRPREDYCFCGARTEYVGFVKLEANGGEV